MTKAWIRKSLLFFQTMFSLYFKRRVSRSSAELAYFLILSCFPILICVNAFVGRLDLDVNAITNAVDHILPKESLSIITEYLTYIGENQSTALLIGGISMTLFSASAAFRALMDVMADIDGHSSYQGLGQVLASVVNSILFLLIIFVSILVLLTGNWLFQLLELSLPWLAQVVAYWQMIRFFLLFGLMLLFVLLTYHMAAPRGGGRKIILPGALFSTITLVASAGLFSWFIGLSSRYAMVYGSLTSVILLLVWLYLCGNLLIIGYLMNHVLTELIEGETNLKN